MENKFDLDELIELLKDKKLSILKEKLMLLNEVDIAEFIDELSPVEAAAVFRMLHKDIAADVFSNLPSESQQVIIEAATDQEIAAIIEELYVDDAVDMIEELPANIVRRVLKNTKPQTRNLINQFLKYPENSAGSIMTAEFIDFRKESTVGEAIAKIRRTGEDSETIYTCFVVDSRRVIEGVITVKDLLLASDEQTVEEVMDPNVITVTTSDDQEAVTQLLHRYDFLSVPVVDQEKRLVGIVTVDDAVDVMEEETTEDFEKMAAMLPSEKPYLKTSVFTLAKNRIVWLLILLVSGMVTGLILGKYETAFAAIPILVTFIPMLTDTGGNAGSQSSTMIIRGMAVGEIQPRDFLKVVWKEMRVSLLVGLALSFVNFLRVLFFCPGANFSIAITVSIALFCTVLIAKTIGGVLPMVAKLLHADPAIMAAPLITTIVDAFSLIIYFSVAQAIIGI